MDSGCSDSNLLRSRWSETSIVYSRKNSKRALKKGGNSNDNGGTVGSSAEAAPSTAAAPSENPASALASAGVSSPAVATATTAETSNSSPYQSPNVNDCDGKDGSSPGREDVLQEAVVTEDADTPQRRSGELSSSSQEQTPSRSSADKNENSSVRQQDSGGQTVEPQHSNRVSPLHSENELPQASGGERGASPRELPLSSGENKGTESAEVQLPVENEQQDQGELRDVLPEAPSGNGPANANGIVKHLVTSRVDDRVRFNLSKATPKNEIEELKIKLERELYQVRRLAKRLEVKEPKLASYNTQSSNHSHGDSRNHLSVVTRNVGEYSYPQSHDADVDMVDSRALMNVNSEANVVGHREHRPMELSRVNSDVGVVARSIEPRHYHRQLSVAVMENNYSGSDYVEKEKRTPKANQYYRNSEFLLGKDRLPPESNKRLKLSNGRKSSAETFGSGFGFDKALNQAFRSCSSLLQRLMKHKHGWVFNEPVNAQAMGCADYHDIIKNPMDLGTIKTRLSQNQYKTPMEFAEDVRLVFRNAMTYNPKGHDVHGMAEQLVQIFEERWAIIETEYNSQWNYQMYQGAGLPTPPSRRGRPQSHFAPAPASHPGFVPALMQGHIPAPAPAPIVLYAPPMGSLDRPAAAMAHMAFEPRSRAHVARTPAPKKPKARDLNKRDMTYDEKQRLSTNLQGLPSEKLDAIVQIIKRRSTALSQNDDEIEVDIDSVDTETLWELDRFVSNYKKSLSKYRRKAELAHQARMANQNLAVANAKPVVAKAQTENGTVQEKNHTPPAVNGEKQVNNGSRSSSSSSSSSDSGSSSSDSDSDSSSADGSGGGQSPKT